MQYTNKHSQTSRTWERVERWQGTHYSTQSQQGNGKEVQGFVGLFLTVHRVRFFVFSRVRLR